MEEEIKSIDILMENGEVASANVVSFLQDEETNKEYVLYSFETDEALETKRVYASIFVNNENGYELLPIEDEQEWNNVNEEIIRLASKGENIHG